MTTDTGKITTAADDLGDKLTKGGSAAKTLGAEIANAIKSLDDRVTALESGGGNVSPPVPGNEYGLIENFSGANGARFKVDSLETANDNANKSWSLTKIDDYTLRFEVRKGDVYTSAGGGWTDPSTSERCEVSFSERYDQGVMVNWEGTVTILPGPVNTGSWLGLLQLHATTDTPPCPVAIQLEQNTDKLQVIVQDPNTDWRRVYLSSGPIQRGQPMRFKVKTKMAPSGGGYCGVWLNDQQIVDFNGAIGATGSQYWWKYGVYRGTATEKAQVDFSHVHITTG